MQKITCLKNIEPLCEVVPAATIAIDANYRITLFNKSAESMLNVPRGNVLGKDVREVISDGGSSSGQSPLDQTLQNGTAHLHSEKSFVAGGRSFTVSLDTFPLFANDTKVDGAIMVMRDLNYIRETEHRSHHLETLAGIGEMAAGTVHEIRNPLTSIGGFVQLMQARAARQTDQTSVDYCRLITEEIKHINNILSDFLTLAKPQNDKREKVNVVQLVYDVLTLMYGEALLFQISLVPRLPEEPLYFVGNPEKIKEVLINISRNAFQAMAPGGILTITATADKENIHIDINDTGHGMSEAVKADIFKPFFTTKEAGTGLGLAICQRIIREHQGEIKVSSQIEQGTTFTLLLPRLAAGPE